MKFSREKFWLALQIIAAAVIAAGTVYLFSDHLLSSDEGVVLNAAWQLWNGKKMYTDFVWYITPGAPEFLFLIWKLWGVPSYAAAKIASVIALLASALGVGFAAKRFSSSRLAPFFAAMLWISAAKFYVIINHNSLSSFVAVFALLLMLKHMNGTHSVKNAIALGLTLAVTTALLQTKGGILFIACLALFFFWRVSWKEIYALIGSYAIPLAAYLLRWSPVTLLNALIVYPNQNYWGPNSFLNQPGILYAEILILLALMCWLAIKPSRQLATIVAFQAALWLSSTNIFDIQHMFINIFPLCTVAVLLLPTSLRVGAQQSINFFLLALVGALFAVALWSDWRFSPPWAYSIFDVDILGRGQIITDVLKTHHMTSLYAGPGLPGFYFEIGEPNPYPYAELTTPAPGAFDVMTKTIQAANPEYVILDYNDIIQRYHYSLNNPLDTYIASHYRWCGYFPYTRLLIGTRTTCPIF